MNQISFEVNGQAAAASINPADTLLHVLRNHMDLKGTRYGCAVEECGACMVLVNGKPTYSCTFAAQDIGGKTVTTIEGLAPGHGNGHGSGHGNGHGSGHESGNRNGDALHPLQAAFLDEQAGQCGYCLSGIIISAAALLDANPNPRRADIVAALEPHLCRCGAQTRMLRAVERAAAAMRAGPVS